MPVRDRLALMAVRAHCVGWLFYVGAMVWRHEPVPAMDWAILPSGVTAILLACYGKDYVYRGRHHGRAVE